MTRTTRAPLMTVDELKAFGEFLYRRTGMIFGETKRYYSDRRIADRMDATDSHSFGDYFLLLKRDAAEAERLINAFTVNETYFYREEHQLRALSRSILPAIVANRRPGDLVRIWSLPCSTGEEPYSIAIWLLENWALVDAYHIEIVGSDIDTDAIADAKAGVYGDRALSRLSPELIDRYFEPKRRHHRKIIDDLRESVTFTSVNLIDADSMRAQGLFDVIFCRNVLIYFDDASRLAGVRNIFESLNPGGFACLGHTESMARITDLFDVARFEDAIVYRKP